MSDAGELSPAHAAFERLASELLREPPVSRSAGKGFGAGALTTNGKIFAALRDTQLLLKLPRGRVDGLTSSGLGVPFDANKGRAMKEFAMLPREWAGDPAKARHWIGVAFEWTSKRPKKVEPTKKPSRTPAPPKARARKRR